MKLKVILLAVTLHISCTGQLEKTAIDDSQEILIIKEFEHQLKKDLEDDNIDGSISAAIVKEDKIIWSKAFGFRDRETQMQSDSNTLYRIGSVTKTFTAFLMMQLSEEGTIELSDPIEKYVPEVRQIRGYSNDTNFSFIQLASHTSGLSREPDFDEAFSGPVEEWQNKLLQSLPHTSFRNNNDGTYAYSNIGFAILGLALSRAANKPYIELVKSKIFAPLKMHNSFFQVPESKKHQIAQGMEGGPFGDLNLETPKQEHSGRGYKVPNGAIYSTPRDLAKFTYAMMGYENIISNKSLEEMEKSLENEDKNWWQSYGLGVRLLRDSVVSTAGHTGAVSGYTASFMYQKEGNYGIVIMRNYNWGMTGIDMRSFVVLRRLKRQST